MAQTFQNTAKLVKGTTTGTGAAINISLGFAPYYVKVWNDTTAVAIEWTSDRADAAGFKQNDIADNGSTGDKSCEVISSNGISAYAGTSSAAVGFTIGADTDLNVNTNTLYYIAIG